MLLHQFMLIFTATSDARQQSEPGSGLSLDTFVTAIGIVVGLGLWWKRVKKIELEGLTKAILSFLDLAVLIVTIVLFRWLGAIIFVIVSAIATIVISIKLAAEQQSILTSAAINSRESVTRADMEALHRRLRKQDDGIQVIGPIAEAKLLLLLAQRSRSMEEIEAMAPVIAKLWYMHKGELPALVEGFDRLLRLYGMTAAQSVEAANKLTAAMKQTVGTFDEVLDALIIAGGGTLPGRHSKTEKPEAQQG